MRYYEVSKACRILDMIILRSIAPLFQALNIYVRYRGKLPHSGILVEDSSVPYVFL